MSDKMKALVVSGTLCRGFEFIGPFETVIEADQWARSRCSGAYTIEVIKLPDAMPVTAISDRSIPIPPDGLGGNPV